MNPEEKEMLEIGKTGAVEIKPIIDPTKFKPITSKDLLEVLGLTIKKDETNKLVTFLAQISCYTENSQLNISFNAPSAAGKSFIALEISDLFPAEDVMKLGACSPTAFYHEQGEYDKEANTITVDLSRKIIIFLDQPGPQLLERLRSLLSHDEKQIKAKITDKNQRGGNRTKTVIIKGFPAVIFCTAGLKLDEQEATRFLLLSPEINSEKLRQAIFEKIKKETDNKIYKEAKEANPERTLLKERILAIKQANIEEIKISSPKIIEEKFFNSIHSLKPRHQRDISKVISLVKIFALLNLWYREKEGNTILANEDDIKEAFELWEKISESQELNLPPYILDLYRDVILLAYEEKNVFQEGAGLTRLEISRKHSEVYGRFLPDWQLRQWILPMLEASGLINQEPDPNDKRKILVYPTPELNKPKQEINSELTSGVEGGKSEQN